MFTAPREQGPVQSVLAGDEVTRSESTAALPLGFGASGPSVADLQTRLAHLGFDSAPDAPGIYAHSTEAAVRAFQRERGLRSDGVCGRQTWEVIVEAGYRLGDRLLYRRSPMLQGDDVAELQRRLSALGFDPGGVDGIFGDGTSTAVAEFQRNVGLTSDGICGPVTLVELNRLGLGQVSKDLVTSVRERYRVTLRPGPLAGRRIAVGEPGGFAVAVRAVSRALSAAGALPVPLHLPDGADQAVAANVAGVDCYIGLRLDPEQSWVRSLFYRGYRYESLSSRSLAELMQPRVVSAVGLLDGGIAGMALPELRGTQMPAVLIELGAPNQVVMRTAELGLAVAGALDLWLKLGSE